LQDVLFSYGVEFPCGGTGRCKGCRLRVLRGNLPPSPQQAETLTAGELEEGWRLACLCNADDDLTLDVGQWEAPILTDHTPFHFIPADGYGIAIDLGTTTLAAQILDLRTGQVLGVETSRNPQAVQGADIMSRVQYALAASGQKELESLIRQETGRLVKNLTVNSEALLEQVRFAVVVGNTVMHHLFGGVEITPLSHYPFEPVKDGRLEFSPSQLGWPLPGSCQIAFLPCLGGFVGSDILAGILATRIHEGDDLCLLIDLGTNGEIVLGNRQGMHCASTAAGPAFEGGRISMGMQASSGAISAVELEEEKLKCHVIGNVPPRGICGSGLVDAVAAGLSTEVIGPSGRIRGGKESWLLLPPVSLTQADIRELQLAKGAIAAGIQILLERRGARESDIKRIYLAGAFGNYINLQSARRIGMLDFPEEKIEPVGNTALLGAKIALFQWAAGQTQQEEIRSIITHVPLAADPLFQEKYVEAMTFPNS